MGVDSPLQPVSVGREMVVPRSEIATLDETAYRDANSHVSLVASGPASPEALLVGVVLGALSAMLVVFAFGYSPGDVLRSWSPGMLFAGAWISSIWLLTKDTGRVLVVMRRGFILGALQWAVLTLEWSGSTANGVADSAITPAAGVLWPSILMQNASSTLVCVCVIGFVSCWLFTRSPYRELGTNRP